MRRHPWMNKIVHEEGTRGTETSKYPEEKKEKLDFPSSGERTGNSLNHRSTDLWGFGPEHSLKFIAEYFWKVEPKRVTAS